MTQRIKQAKVVSLETPDPSMGTELLALFNANGTPYQPEAFVQAAAQADVGVVTSTVAAGATPTKAEFDALRVDALATRTVLNALLAKLRTAGTIDT